MKINLFLVKYYQKYNITITFIQKIFILIIALMFDIQV